MMTELEAIKKRHSVRKYKAQPIDADVAALLHDKIAEVNKAGNLHLQFLEDAGNAFSKLLNKAMGLGSAPAVIACVGPDDDTLDERVGYYGEQIVLYAQQLGLNTCWAGTYNKKGLDAQVAAGERVSIAIAIGYGENQGREGRKSKTPAQVTKVQGEKPAWFDHAVELALMAPTAINQQRFEILCKDGKVAVRDKGGAFSKVDLGIVRYHVAVGKKTGKTS